MEKTYVVLKLLFSYFYVSSYIKIGTRKNDIFSFSLFAKIRYHISDDNFQILHNPFTYKV